MTNVVYIGGPLDGKREQADETPALVSTHVCAVRVLHPGSYGLPGDMTYGVPAYRYHYYGRRETQTDGTVVYRLVGDGVKF